MLAGMSAQPTPQRPRTLLLQRLLSLFYDLWPALALWLLTAIPFVLLDLALSGNARHNIEPFSALAWAQWLCCWLVTGLYATASWRRGGQTLGMRPWRIAVTGTGPGAPSRRQLWLRYAVGTLSVLAAGLGFWWSLLDRQRLTWHDRASGTRTVRVPRQR